MKRAVVLIGVRKAHNLPELQAVWDGVQSMKEWALSQGIEEDLIKAIIDDNKKVTPQDIKDAVNSLVDRGDIEQLIIYFAGHGVNVQYGEYWLLSDAIIDADAAVNVKGSEELARYGIIPHVIFLSDACRTAAQGIQAQGIRGSTIFRNKPASGPEKSVDLFFATLIGDPALEIADPNDAAQGFKAVYTEALVEALQGQHLEIAQRDDQTGVELIRPRPLKKFLARDLPIRVFQATQGANPRNQQPDARITSDDDAWLSAIRIPTGGTSPPKFGTPPSHDALAHAEFAQLAIERVDVATRAMLSASGSDIEKTLWRMPANEKIERADLDLFSARNREFRNNAIQNAEPFGPPHMETNCGFKLRGAVVTGCAAHNVVVEISNEGDGDVVKAHLSSARGSVASVLLTLNNGCGVLLPAIGEFLTSLTFDADRLVDVAYEPSDNSSRWQEYQSRASELRSLRAVIATSSRLGTFRLEGDDAELLARRMQIAKGIDPSLALYAAHAYRDQGNRGRIREMANFMRNDLGFCPFDIALLAGTLNDQLDDPQRKSICPFLPMLAQTWALMSAYEVALPPALKDISRHVLPNSLWTMFDADGVRLISQVLQEGNVR